MKNWINKLVNKFLIIKNLKYDFGLLIIIIGILFAYTFYIIYNNEIQFSEILAPVMIAISALLASTVAMINLRSTYINRVEQETKKDRTTLLHFLSKMKFIIKKLPLYKSGIEKLDKLDYATLIEYISVFSNYGSIINDKKLIYYLYDEQKDLIDRIDTYLFFIKNHNQSLKLSFENNNCKLLERLDADNIKYQLEKIESLIIDSKDLRDAISKRINEVSEKQNKLRSEESY